MTIGEVSKRYHLSTDTLRYYEKIGLLDPITRQQGKRNFQEEDCVRLDFIRCMKNAGFSLEDILHFIRLGDETKESVQKRFDMLLNQQERLLEEMKQKRQTLDFLNYKIDLYRKKKEEWKK